MQSKDNLAIFYRHNEVLDQKATVLLIHGLGEHSGRYLHVTKRLEEEGFNTWCLDLRGHGQSQGIKGDITDFSAYEQDVMLAIDHIQKKLLVGEKLFILGHSMGALITLRTVANHHPAISGMVLSSPLFALKFPVPKWKMQAVLTFASFLPTCRVKTNIKGHHLSKDPSCVSGYDNDPLVLKSLSIRGASEIFKGYQNVNSLAANIPNAFFMQLAGSDPVVDPDAAKNWFLKASKNNRDATLKIYPKSLHEIYNEIDREQAIDDAIAWLKVQTAKCNK